MSRVLPTRLAVIIGAAAILLAACSPDGVVSPVKSSTAPSKDIGISVAGIAQVCIDPASPPATYTFSLSGPLGFVLGDTFEPLSVSINTAGPGPICREILRKFDFVNRSIASLFVQVSISPNIPGTWSFTCVDDAGDGLRCSQLIGTTNFIRIGADGSHGSTVTFKFTPLVLVGPFFVIGDEQIHTVGSTVNFWGAHWFPNNPMSGLVSSGASSFKGFAGSATGVCGGTWTSNPGNSTPPPATIPTQIAVIVTSSLNKSGSNISGNIQQILLVDQDGGYNNNPGSDGNGVVTAIACQQP